MRVKPKEYLTVLLANKIYPGITSPKVDLNDDEFAIHYDYQETSTEVKKFLYIKNVAEELDLAQASIWRDAVWAATDDKANVHIRWSCAPHIIDYSTRLMKDRRRNWIKTINQKEERRRRTSRGEGALAEGYDVQLSQKESWLIRTWKFLLSAEENQRQLLNITWTIEIVVLKKHNNYKRILYKATKVFKERVNSSGCEAVEVKNYILDYLQATSIVSLLRTEITSKVVPKKVVTDLILSRLLRVSPGENTPTLSIPVAFDIHTMANLWLQMLSPKGAANNSAIFGGTGSGKSRLVKDYIGASLAYTIDTIVWDYEGFEYTKFCENVGGTRIAIGSEGGGYPDTLILPQPTGIEEVDSASYERSLKATIAIFDCICDIDGGMNHMELSIFNEAWNLLNTEYGIVREIAATWINSAQLSYKLLYKKIATMSSEEKYITEYGNSLHELKHKLIPYFDDNGIYRTTFSKKLSLEELLPSTDKLGNLIVFSYDAQTKTSSGNVRVELALKQITCAYVTASYAIRNRLLGRVTNIVIEEYQRYQEQEKAERVASEIYTGARKLNVNSLLLSNSPHKLYNSKNMISADIRDNIQNFFISGHTITNIDDLTENLELPGINPQLKAMSEKPDKYEHIFLAYIAKRDKAFVKSIVSNYRIELSGMDDTRTLGNA